MPTRPRNSHSISLLRLALDAASCRLLSAMPEIRSSEPTGWDVTEFALHLRPVDSPHTKLKRWEPIIVLSPPHLQIKRSTDSLQCPQLLVTQPDRDRDYAAATRSHCCVHRDGSWCSAENERVFLSLSLPFCGTRQRKRRFAEIFLHRSLNICFFGSELWNDSFQRMLCKERGLGSSIQARKKRGPRGPSNDRYVSLESVDVACCVTHAKSAVVLTARPELSAVKFATAYSCTLIPAPTVTEKLNSNVRLQSGSTA